MPIASRTVRTSSAVLLLLAVHCNLPSTPAHATDETPAEGLRLAQKLCSNCHDVGTTSRDGKPHPAPSFRRIAARPGQNAIAVAGSIIMPHPAMPNVPLTRAEVRSLVAYISSLHSSGHLPMGAPVLPSPPPAPKTE